MCRLAYVDYACVRATNGRDLRGIDVKIAYDAACAWCAKISERFAKHFPESKELMDRVQFSIDALHVNDHLDRCMYLYSAAYQDCVGHFHGVGTEQYWSENNQMGPQTRQMNPGHRHDKIISHHSDWNWKKIGKHGGCLLATYTSCSRLDSAISRERSSYLLGAIRRNSRHLPKAHRNPARSYFRMV